MSLLQRSTNHICQLTDAWPGIEQWEEQSEHLLPAKRLIVEVNGAKAKDCVTYVTLEATYHVHV